MNSTDTSSRPSIQRLAGPDSGARTIHHHLRQRSSRKDAWSVFTAAIAGVLFARFILADTEAVTPGFHLSPVLFGSAGLLSASLLLIPRHVARPIMLMAVLLVGAGATHARLAELPHHHLSRLHTGSQPTDPAHFVRIRGLVMDRPSTNQPAAGSLDAKITRFNSESASFLLQADSLVTGATGDTVTPVSGSVRVFATGHKQGDIMPGDRIEVLGLFRPQQPPANPGSADSIAWARQSGRAGSLSANAETIQHIPPVGWLKQVAATGVRLSDRMRSSALSLVQSETPDAEIVRAMLLGERSPDGRQATGLARTGVSHLLAISGFHLAVLLGLTVGIVRSIGDFPRTEAIVGLVFIALYVAVVPVRTPILRAALLASIVLIAHLFARKWDRLTLLGWVSACIAIARPMDVTTLGFQLTIGTTFLLIWLTDTKHPWVFIGGMRFDVDQTLISTQPWHIQLLNNFRGLVVTSFLVWALAAPVVLWHTGSLNPLAPIAVIVATPIAVMIQVFGMAGLLFSMISEPIGSLSTDAALAAARLLVRTMDVFDRIPTAGTHPPVSVGWSVAAVGSGVFLLIRARLRDPMPWMVIGVVLVWFVVETRAARELDSGVAARVDMLAVGDGSCLLVRSGDDAMLWDAGSLRPGLGVRTIPRALRALGSPRVPVAFITHANIDHYAALPDAARTIGLERVLVSAPALATMRASEPESAEQLFLLEMQQLGVDVLPIARGETFELGPSSLRVIWPPVDPPASIRARNDRSLVARLDVPTNSGERRMLFNGDIQRSAMLLLLADHEAHGETVLGADVIELPHHGSHHAVAEQYVMTTNPAVVLQSTGPSRAGDRRWNNVKQALGSDWLITAINGAVGARVLFDGSVEAGSKRPR